MSLLPYEMRAEAITLALWEHDTGNGTGLDRDEWESHMQNCHAAVANTYTDGVSDTDWYVSAQLRLIGLQESITLSITENHMREYLATFTH